MQRPRFLPRIRASLDEYRALAEQAGETDDRVGRFELIRDFLPWHRSQGRSGLDDGRPWITFEATRAIGQVLNSTMKVFEYGTGGSTLFFASRVASVVSVENDPVWFEVMQARVAGRSNVEISLAPGEPPAGPEDLAFPSRSTSSQHLTFRKYVQAIDRFPDGHFDLLLVDGRSRPAAFFRGEPKVRIGGLIVLDDSTRSGYAAAVNAATAAGWPAIGRVGPKPYSPSFARTTVWTKTSPLPDRQT
jgi:hypothetical protein